MGILFYAVGCDEENVVKELLNILKRDFTGKLVVVLNHEFERVVIPHLASQGLSTALMSAAMLAKADILVMLLESGANSQCMDVMGNDVFMLICIWPT